MEIHVSPDKKSCGLAAANKGGELLRRAIAEAGRAAVVIAAGASQFDFLEALTGEPDIDWSKATVYQPVEYLGLGEDHPASFRRRLNERLLSLVHPGAVHLINGQNPDPQAECDRLKKIISADRIDVAFVGLGENGCLGLGDHPADPESGEPYIVVALDKAYRTRQYEDGWFPTLADAPRAAVAMTEDQIMKAKAVVCTAPGERKAGAVRDCFEGKVDPARPASRLQRRRDAFIFLDEYSASLMD